VEAPAVAAAPDAGAPPPPPPEPASLDAGQIAASVAANRLRDPRTLAVVVFLILLIGIAIGRRRR
jgi:hypothetical protein